jgi:membrane protease YdiL (CAAX protease family)
MAETFYLLLNAALFICAGISLVLWVRLLPAIYRQGVRGFADTWLPVRRRECPFWGVAEIFVMFGAMMVSGQLLLLLAQQKGWYQLPEPGESLAGQTPEMLFVVLAISALANCVSIGVILLWMWNIDRANIGKFGLSINRSMLGLGLKAVVMLLPPVLVLAALVNLLVADYEHEVLDVLQQLGTPRVFAVLFFGTAIVTPIAEEILFRGLIQGGLQRLADRIVGQVESSGSDLASSPQSANEGGEPLLAENTADDSQAGGTSAQGNWEPVSYWPVIVASLIFASMHLGQGAAPIPLFLLSVGLGYLYRQTGSLIPCIAVHMVLNGMTLLAAMLQ